MMALGSGSRRRAPTPRRGGRPEPIYRAGTRHAEFPCGDFATIIGSIDELIFSRHAPETIVMPGHGDDTTIGRESPHLAEWIDRGW